MWKILWVVLILFALDAAVFRSGWYSSFLSTESVQGRSQRIVEELEEMPATPTANILLLGDARLSEGFNAGVASARVVEHGIRFLPAESPGTGIREWCYFLEEIDPEANRFRAVVLAFGSFRKRPPEDRMFDDVAADADVLAPVVSTRALLDLIESRAAWGDRAGLAPRVVLSAWSYRQDLRELLTDPVKRWRNYEGRRATFGLPMYGAYAGHPENVVGLAWNSATGALQFPARLSAVQRREIEQDVRKANADLAGAADDFTARWLDRIARRYGRGTTRLILVRLPSTPIPAALGDDSLAPARFVVESQGRANVILAPESAFGAIERPETFFDGRLLNADGRRELTRRMTELLVSLSGDGRIGAH